MVHQSALTGNRPRPLHSQQIKTCMWWVVVVMLPPAMFGRKKKSTLAIVTLSIRIVTKRLILFLIFMNHLQMYITVIQQEVTSCIERQSDSQRQRQRQQQPCNVARSANRNHQISATSQCIQLPWQIAKVCDPSSLGVQFPVCPSARNENMNLLCKPLQRRGVFVSI